MTRTRIFGNASGITLLKENLGTVAKGMAARITSAFNSGWQSSDIRRTYLADSVVETVTSANLVSNSTFDSNTTGWLPYAGAGGTAPTIASVSNKLQITSGSVGSGRSVTPITTVVGSCYQVKADFTAGSESAANLGTSNNSDGSSPLASWAMTNGSTTTKYFIATTTTTYIWIQIQTATNGGTASFDNVYAQRVDADRSYKAMGANIYGSLTKALSSPSASNQLVAYSGFSAANYLQEPYSSDLDFGTSEWNVSAWVNIPTGNAAAGMIAERNYSSGAYFTLGITSANYVTATAYDGTTNRTVTTSAAYNTGVMLKARAVYRLDGSLSIMVNGVQVAVTYGNPLLTLTNTSAVLTIGNNYALTAPFPGSIALLKLSATAPTPDQSVWMYEQEKHLFRDGANCLLPDSGSIVDLTYDEVTDKWVAVSATNESDWTGLVRTNVIAVPAGSNIKAAASSGIKLNARSTTSPGVDVTIPAWNLREELVKRAEAAAKKAQPVVIFDYSGGFTATTVNGNTAITSVASLTYPAQGSLIGATVTGTGIPASTVIVAISGTTIYLSNKCTASNSAVQIALSDFILPVGYETRAVLSAGAVKQEGSTKDWTRSFDSFREKVTFGTAPGYSAFVEIQAVRSLA